MSWTELTDEIVKDFWESQIRRRMMAIKISREREFRKVVLAKKNKLFSPVPVKTKRNNTIYIFPVSEWDQTKFCYRINQYYLMPIFYQNHLWIVSICKKGATGEFTCSYLSHHLLCRYEERFNGKEEWTEQSLKKAAMFFARNSVASGQTMTDKKTGRRYFFCLFDDGVVLGDLIETFPVYKTFIRYDMLHEDQRKVYEELKEDFEKHAHSSFLLDDKKKVNKS